MVSAGKKKPRIFQLKATLRDIAPPIWRRFQVRGIDTLGELDGVLQAVMGWDNCHLHHFEIDGVEYGIDDPDYADIGSAVEDEEEFPLSKILKKDMRFVYVYDFGDNWVHDIEVEDYVSYDKKQKYPVCLEGKRHCPPEDSGGPWSYPEFLDAIQNPDNEEHESMLEWVGGSFDPEAFSAEEINKRMHWRK